MPPNVVRLVKGGNADAMLATQLRGQTTGFGVLENSDDLAA